MLNTALHHVQADGALDRRIICDGLNAAKSEIERLLADNKALTEALVTIAGGWTDRFPGAPNVMNETPEEFRSKMWTWSQKVAQAAVDGRGEA